jgi:hypothetical protein
MLQVDAESLLDQLHKCQSAQDNSEDIMKLQSEITQLQVCKLVLNSSVQLFLARGRFFWPRLHFLVKQVAKIEMPVSLSREETTWKI